MTATGYNAVTDSELEPGKPLTTGLAFRFRDNPLALAQRGAGAPWLNGVGNTVRYDVVGSTQVYTWTVPDGVYHAEFTMVGGGSHAADLANGEASSVSGIGSAEGGAFSRETPPEGLWSNNGGRKKFFSSGAAVLTSGVGGEIVIIKAAVTPGATHTVTVGKGGESGSAPSENGGAGCVIIRY